MAVESTARIVQFGIQTNQPRSQHDGENSNLINGEMFTQPIIFHKLFEKGPFEVNESKKIENMALPPPPNNVISWLIFQPPIYCIYLQVKSQSDTKGYHAFLEVVLMKDLVWNFLDYTKEN